MIYTFQDENKQLNPAEVKISTSLETVIDIAERSHIIELKFEMNIEWYEHRVEYFNIKENSALNSLTENEIKLLWLPYIIFEVTLHLNTIISRTMDIGHNVSDSTCLDFAIAKPNLKIKTDLLNFI